jgi:SnoaL-like domain
VDPAVQTLLDRAAICDVLLRYARAVDRRDLQAVAACFVPGAAYDGALGTGTIETALAALPERLARYTGTMHSIHNQYVEIAGDRATSETYAVAYHRVEGGGTPALRVAGLRYLDEFVRRDGVWLISRRVVKAEWEQSA